MNRFKKCLSLWALWGLWAGPSVLCLALAATPALAQDEDAAAAPAESAEASAPLDSLASPDEMFEAARTAYRLKDFQTAQIAATSAAADGVAEAMTLLGYMHERGLGGLRDEAKALKWYQAAGRKNEPDALMALAAYAMESEHGLTPADARNYLQRALDAGRDDAALDLAQLYIEGRGGAPDRDKGLRLLETAAGTSPEAAYRAGVILSDEKNGDTDDVRAAAYFKQAAGQGHPAAATLYAHALYEGVGVAVDKPEAALWYAKAAERGDTEGQVYHALMLALVEGDVEKSAYWLERSRISEGPEDAVTSYAPIRAKLDSAIKAKLTADELEAVRAKAHVDVGT